MAQKTRAGYQAHHMVATGDRRAAFARSVLQRAGIHPNSAVNGVWMKGCNHRCVHTDLYYKNVNKVLAKYREPHPATRFLIENDLRLIARNLANGSFPYK